ncbi:MAG: TonB-dependent receptor [Chitinophagaceae bacterium]|nr:TonB-dependent receptor [Chitinophagaceae bacterium]
MKGLLLFVFTVVVFNSNAQTKTALLKGTVVNNSTNEPIPGASVFIPDLKKGTAADEKGNFILKDIPAGKHLVEVSSSGYTSIIEQIFIHDETAEQFKLKPSVTENNEVVVTGVSTATSLRKITTPVAVIRKQDLLQAASSNIIDALTKIPGVNAIATGPAVSKPVIRGLGFNRVVTINDGLRQEGQQWGDEHGIEIDEYSIQKAEVLKGPASLMYGSDAIAGVINFITNTPVTDGTLKGNVLASYQTNNRQRGFNGNIAGNKNGISFNAYGSYKAAGDYKNAYDGYVLNSKFNELNTGGFIGLNKKWGYSHLIFSNFNQKLGMTEGERNAAGEFLNFAGSPPERVATNADFKSITPFVPYQHIIHQKIVSDNSFYLRKGKLNVNAGVQRNRRMEFGNPEDAGEKELYFDLKTVNYNVQYHFAPVKEWKWSMGIAGMNQGNTNKGVEAIIPDYTLNDIGGFVFVQKKIKQINFSGGIRFDNRNIHSKLMKEGNDIKFEAFQKNFSNVSASAGITYEFPKAVLLRLNVARGFRAPNLAELSSNGAHEGTNRFEVGNRNLKSEISLQGDAGMEINTEHISLSASLFLNSINNYIYFEKSPAANGGDSIIVIDGKDFYLFRFVQQNASLYGFEFSLDIHPHPLHWLHFKNSFSYVRGILSNAIENNRNIPFIPAPRLLSELRINLQHQKHAFNNTYFKLEMDYNLAQNKVFTAFNTETATPSYTLINMGLGTDIKQKNKTVCSVFIAANNLFDVAYQNHLNRLKYLSENTATGRMGVFNMGRNLSLKVNVPLDFKW